MRRVCWSRAAAVGVDRERLAPDLLLGGRLGDQLPRDFPGFAVLHRPPDAVAAEHVEDRVEVEVRPLRRAEELGDVPRPPPLFRGAIVVGPADAPLQLRRGLKIPDGARITTQSQVDALRLELDRCRGATARPAIFGMSRPGMSPDAARSVCGALSADVATLHRRGSDAPFHTRSGWPFAPPGSTGRRVLPQGYVGGLGPWRRPSACIPTLHRARRRAHTGRVIAPSDALPTWAAYLASTPVV